MTDLDDLFGLADFIAAVVFNEPSGDREFGRGDAILVFAMLAILIAALAIAGYVVVQDLQAFMSG